MAALSLNRTPVSSLWIPVTILISSTSKQMLLLIQVTPLLKTCNDSQLSTKWSPRLRPATETVYFLLSTFVNHFQLSSPKKLPFLQTPVTTKKKVLCTYKKHINSLNAENYKMLIKEIKEDLSWWKDIMCSWIRTFNLVKISPSWFMGLMQFLSKSQPRFYKHKEVYPKIYMGRHSIYIAKRLLKRSTVKRILLLTSHII